MNKKAKKAKKNAREESPKALQRSQQATIIITKYARNAEAYTGLVERFSLTDPNAQLVDFEVKAFAVKGGVVVWLAGVDDQETSKVRDAMGQVLSLIPKHAQLALIWDEACGHTYLEAAFLGLELGLYKYALWTKKSDACEHGIDAFPYDQIETYFSDSIQLEFFGAKPKKSAKAAKSSSWQEAREAGLILGRGVNIARHLVNMPPADLNPKTYAAIVKQLFKGVPHVDVEIFDAEKLQRERCRLLLAVGRGAEETARMVHIRYRPSGKKKSAPVAFVGKGITFDTGGLDIKPASGMRLMKKDMGGSASIVGLAHWAAHSQLEQACDFYLAIAENAVSAKSFHPGDVIQARSGMTVEIHNTDAEGRLVMADVLDYAATRKGADEPSLIIDASTLTGAMRVALGPLVAGFFASSDDIAEKLSAAAKQAGEIAWQMPLIAEYESYLKSGFADIANAGDSGFAGAITAALFLQKFTHKKPWAHFDIFCWGDRPRGAYLEMGGTGQSIQTFARFLTERV